MKVVMNGGIHLSVLDGWWAEGYQGDNGWAIGAGEEYGDTEEQDRIESMLLCEILEEAAAPLFYRRGGDGLPRDWISMMKASMRTLCPVFNTNRMVEEYVEKAYLPAALGWRALSEDGYARAREFAVWRSRIREHWKDVAVREVEPERREALKVGGDLPVRTVIDLGALSPEDVSVELYYGPLDAKRVIVDARVVALKPIESAGGTLHRYGGAVPLAASGRHGFVVRVRPHRAGTTRPVEAGLVVWG
jgi:starch phosphorylase